MCFKVDHKGDLSKKKVNSVGASAVMPIWKKNPPTWPNDGDGINLGVDVNYNIKDKELFHHFNLVKTDDEGDTVTAMNIKNGKMAELVLSKQIKKDFYIGSSSSPKPTKFTIERILGKAQYGFKSSELGGQIAIDAQFDTNLDYLKYLNTESSRAVLDIKTTEFKFSDHMKINDNAKAVFSVSTNLSKGFFKKPVIGMALKFNY